jgi:hypothetical protein
VHAYINKSEARPLSVQIDGDTYESRRREETNNAVPCPLMKMRRMGWDGVGPRAEEKRKERK